ncbi:MAG: hypothetical protein K5910_07775 [Bacteroidales bacterium]|nr:hypothetical protein [Bacteroidales bacterium]
MCRTYHKLFLTALLMLFCLSSRGQDRFLLGSFQSPKGAGVSAFFISEDGTETDIITLRTDFYGFLSGRTKDLGAAVSYTHDYALFFLEGPDFLLQVHAGAGGLLGYAHDYEKGFFSTVAADRMLERNSGWVTALDCNAGLRVDFLKHFTLDVGFSICPGIHLRADKNTGALLLTFYKCGVYTAYYPQINLMYRF